jgi:hypothetical protein
MHSSISSSEPRQVLRFAFRCLLMAAILAVVLTPLAKLYEAKIKTDTAEKAIWILAIKNKQYDYAFIGASRVFNGISPVEIDSLLGSNGINLGTSGAGFPENLLLLRQFWKNGNTIKNLIVEVNSITIGDPVKRISHSFSDEKFLFLYGDPTVDSIIRANTNPVKHYFREYIPFFKYAEYNNIYPINKVLFGFDKGYYDYDKEKGSVIFKRVPSDSALFNRKSKPQERAVYQPSESTLRTIVDEARAHGVTVIFYSAPTFKKYLPYEIGHQACHEAIVGIAREKKVPYYDLEFLPPFEDSTLFKDKGHLNADGVTIFSKIISDTLSDFLKK